MRGRAVVSLGLACALLAPTQAGAIYDPVGSGTAKRSFERGFLSLLARNGVKLQARSPAKLAGRTLTLPVTGGKMDPVEGLGTSKTEGILAFVKGNRSVLFRRIEVKANAVPLQAKVGGGQLKVATSTQISSGRAGFAGTVSARELRLTDKVATRLNKKLSLADAFAEGQRIGTLRTSVSPAATTILPEGRATLVPTPEMRTKLEDLFVSLNPIAPAELAPGPILSFPILAGGRLAPDASQGTLRTGGSIELLRLSGGQVFQREYWLDLGTDIAGAEQAIQPSPPYPGAQGRIGVFAIEMPPPASPPIRKPARSLSQTRRSH